MVIKGKILDKQEVIEDFEDNLIYMINGILDNFHIIYIVVINLGHCKNFNILVVRDHIVQID